jgi:hypothetical protein
MKNILKNWKRSATNFSKEYSRFLHEVSNVNQSPGTGIKSFVNDGFGIFGEKMRNCSLGNIERIWNREEVFFVVDWQLYDSF